MVVVQSKSQLLSSLVFKGVFRGRRGRDLMVGSWIYNYLCNWCLSPL